MNSRQEKLENLRRLYFRDTETQGEQILALAKAPDLDCEGLQTIRFLSHTIGGSAILFDLEALGASALRVEDCVRDAVLESRRLSDAESAALKETVAVFETKLRDALSA